MPKGLDRIKLEGKQFGEWAVLEYIGDRKYRCQCSCGNIREVSGYQLLYGKSRSCGNSFKTRQIEIGQKFGEWTVIKNSETEYCLCRCSCGTERKVLKHNLISGDSKSCGHNKRRGKDLTGMTFGEWSVLRKDLDRPRHWICRCSCGKEKSVHAFYLTSGKSRSCGHSTTGLKNLTGKTFGEWTVLNYYGNRFWNCRCSCGNIKKVHSYNLITGQSKSCGCKTKEYTNNTMFERYGDTNPVRIHNPRQPWQIATIANDSAFKTYVLNKISKLNRKILVAEIAEDLDITHDVAYRAVIRNNLGSIIDKFSSKQEREVYDTVVNLCIEKKYDVEDHVKNIIGRSEIDIYIPEIKLAIEFNGDYWHSSDKKGIKYHQNKTIECNNKGIRLIHIFEYEWNIKKTKEKILNLLSEIINNGSEIIYARECRVDRISKSTALEFLNKYHLQSYSESEYNYGIITKDDFSKLLGVMTFGRPRFNQNYEYELIRLCWLPGVRVVGGAEKLFNSFINDIRPKSIITYSDASKFTGTVYERLGFKNLGLTEPNYKWVNRQYDILTRYQTQKQKLLNKGLGTEDQTEDEIMNDLGYYKIYDCGNYKFEYIFK